MMSVEEFERRGHERRKRRDFPPPIDWISIALGCILFFLVCFWIVWGLMA